MPAPVTVSLSDFALAEIRAELGRQDLTRKDLAERLGVERMWVHHRMTGTTPLRLDDLQRISDALGVSFHRLLPPAEVTS